MEWLTCIRSAIDYMEENILTVSGPDEVAENVYISALYLQRGFQIVTGFTIGEYIRNRRLYLAARRLAETDCRVIDAALEYGYETPESFTKAFTRFHGASPSDVRRDKTLIKSFLPLRIHIIIQGGNSMDFTIEKMAAFKVIGFSREFSFEDSYKKIPLFWDEMTEKYESKLMNGASPSNEIEQAICDNRIGEFGVCIDDGNMNGKFRYMIAGRYSGGNVPKEMTVFELPEAEWAKFRCIGKMPQALQSVNTQIWNEWLPGNKDFEIGGSFNIEWYSNSTSPDSPDYQSAIWIPVKRR